MNTKKTLISRITSLFLIVAFAFTMLPAGIVLAEADYEFVVTADKAEVAKDSSVVITVTLNGAMANLNTVQYVLSYDPTKLSVDVSTVKAPFQADWYSTLRTYDAGLDDFRYSSLGQISMPKTSAPQPVPKDEDDNTKNALAVVFQGDNTYIKEGMDIYNDQTAVAGKIVFKALTDIDDTAKEIVIKKTGVLVKTATSAESKTTATVQLVPKPDEDVLEVETLIAAIGNVTLDSNEAILKARNKYNSLTEDQKKLVKNLTVLTDAETKYQNLVNSAQNEALAQELTNEINAIPAVTLDNATSVESQISGARQKYTQMESAGIANLIEDSVYQKLVKAENDLSSAKATLEKIANVKGLIDALGDISLSSKDALEAIETAYAALGENSKYVDNYDAFLSAKETYNKLVEDENKVKAVIDEIDKVIKGEITLESGDDIDAAYNAYNALSDDLKGRVTNKGSLDDAKATYDALVVSDKKVKDVIKLIDEIGTVSVDSGSKILSAENAYAALSANEKSQVTNYATLTKARKDYDEILSNLQKEELDKMAAAAVDELISSIGDVTIDSKEKIESAESAYAALTEEQKGYVENLETLTTARSKYNALKADKDAVDKVIGLINAIGTVTYPDSYNKIKEADDEYNNLKEELKSGVTNLDVLNNAWEKYEELKLDDEIKNRVVALIDEIGEIEYTSEVLEKIEAAEKAYNELKESLKSDIADAYKKLKDAKATYESLKPEVSQSEAALENYNNKHLVVITKIEEDKVVMVGTQEASQVKIGKDVYYVFLTDAPIDPSLIVVSKGTAKKAELGNVDSDDVEDIDATDAMLANQCSAKCEVEMFKNDPMAYIRADVDGNGKITAFDAFLIARKALGYDVEFKLYINK